MKTRILTILFLSFCCIFGANNVEARPRPPKAPVKAMMAPPPPPPGRPVRRVPPPRFINPVGHVYGYSMPGYRIMFNFSPNGRVYREGDNYGSPFIIQGNVITVFSNQVPQTIIGTGKISRDGRSIDWIDYLNGSRYRIRLLG